MSPPSDDLRELCVAITVAHTRRCFGLAGVVEDRASAYLVSQSTQERTQMTETPETTPEPTVEPEPAEPAPAPEPTVEEDEDE